MTTYTNTKSERVAVTSGITTVEADSKERTLRLWSDRCFHVLVTFNGTLTRSSGMPVTERTEVLVHVPANRTVQITLAEGDIDGHLWMTEV